VNTAELDILTWVAAENRPLSNLIAMDTRAANAWIRAHGGSARHIDMYCRLVNTLRYKLFDYLPAMPANVTRLDDTRRLPRPR
jgi:hypothetical protein